MEMDGVDRGDQHRVMGTGFANVSHFKKWYKEVSLGVTDFNFLNAFVARNLLVDELERSNKRGGKCKRVKLFKWKF